MKICFPLLVLALLPSMTFAAQDCLSIHPNAQPEASVRACTGMLENTELPPEVLAEAYENRGIALRELRHFKESLADLELASKLAPENTSIKRMLAWTYREMGKPRKAERMYTDILSLDTHWQGWLSRCVVRYDLRKYADAITDCTEAGKQDYNADVMYFKGAAEVDSGHSEQALKTVAPGLDQEDISGRLYHIAAVALWNLGLHDDATAKAKEGLARYPNDPALMRFLSP